MLILVDGPDCARKTTLVQAIERLINQQFLPRTPTEVLHAGPPTGHPLDEYVTPLLRYRPHLGRHVVCDRWHLGEAVYPAVLGRPTAFDDAVLTYVELFLRSRGALLVVVTPPADELRRCLRTRGDPLVDEEQLLATREGFLDAAARTSLPLVWLKDECVTNELAYAVVGEADAQASRAVTNRLEDFTTYVGDAHPDILLLGDVRKTGTEPGDLRPAFMPYPATSGHYLMRAVASSRRSTSLSVGVANACDVDNVSSLIARLRPSDVVTLGRNAERVVPFSVQARSVPHPQFWRRFHHHDLDGYRDLVFGGSGWS